MYLAELRKFKDIKVTALCDTNEENLSYTAAQCRCENNYTDEDAFFAKGRLADWLIVASPDLTHYRHAKRALELGYNILLEKPVTPNPEELDELCKLAESGGNMVLVCHVLRYTPYFRTIKRIIASGEIGELVNIVHEENAGYWHFAHSFTRGNWRNTADSAPFLLAKCSHDFDLIHWFVDKPCEAVSAYGSLFYFHEGNKPQGATPHCLDGCPHLKTCPYSVEKIYLTKKPPEGWVKAPAAQTPKYPGDKALREILRTGDYGRCVFQCDNNVFDHYSVAMRFEGGTTVTHSVSAFNKDFSRRTHILGTKGELFGRDDTMRLQKNIFGGESRTLKIRATAKGGHGGGDNGLADTIHALMTGQSVPKDSLTTLRETRYSHRMVYAALRSVENGEMVWL
jgi:predicted dehydrogenase